MRNDGSWNGVGTNNADRKRSRHFTGDDALQFHWCSEKTG
jgi:hypothetical protein